MAGEATKALSKIENLVAGLHQAAEKAEGGSLESTKILKNLKRKSRSANYELKATGKTKFVRAEIITITGKYKDRDIEFSKYDYLGGNRNECNGKINKEELGLAEAADLFERYQKLVK